MTVRETALARTFVQLADTLVEDFDVVDLLTVLSDRCVELLGASAVGILLADEGGALQLVAASNEEARVVELFQIQNDEGPCLECHRTGEPVTSGDLAGATRWPRFAPMAVEAGFRSVHAFPMRLRSEVIGALNLFMAEPARMVDDEAEVAQALADAATISILQEHGERATQTLANQLQHALASRVIIEQAKGVLAERAGVDMHEAFERLRRLARSESARLSLVASGLVEGTLPAASIEHLLTVPLPSE